MQSVQKPLIENHILRYFAFLIGMESWRKGYARYFRRGLPNL